MQHGFYFDHKRCVKCHACEIACKTWNEVEIGPRWREVVKIETGTFPEVRAMNVSMASRQSGLSRKHLRTLMAKYGIRRTEVANDIGMEMGGDLDAELRSDEI